MKKTFESTPYYGRYNECTISGDSAIQLYSKSDNSENEIKWDAIDRDLLPWRGGTITTSRGTFEFCAHFRWWPISGEQPSQSKLLLHLCQCTDTSSDEPKTLYFWKAE